MQGTAIIESSNRDYLNGINIIYTCNILIQTFGSVMTYAIGRSILFKTWFTISNDRIEYQTLECGKEGQLQIMVPVSWMQGMYVP